MNSRPLSRVSSLVWRAMFVFLLALCGLNDSPAHAQDPVKWSASVVPENPRVGEFGQIVVTAQIEKPYWIYGPTTPPGGPIAASIEVAESPSLQKAGNLIQPKPKRKMDEGFGIETESFLGAVSFAIPVKFVKAGDVKASVNARFQACNERLCLPPKTVPIPVSFAVSAGAARPEYAKPLLSVPAQPEVAKSDANAEKVETDETSVTGAAGATDDANPNGGAATGNATNEQATNTATTGTNRPEAGGVLAFIGLAFGAGLLAILTPCVFPMVPITVSLFSKRNDGLRGPLVYCAGIIGTFTVLGIAVSAIFGASGLTLLAANPWVNLALATLFIVLALNLFGVYEIVVPSALLQKVQPNRNSHNSLIAPLLMGFAFTLTSFTCTVPFVGTTLVGAATQGPLYPAIGMLAFSTAFALPFFGLAMFPRALEKLPRSGAWLTSVKAFLGFVELAAALKFLQTADYVWNLGLLTRPVFLAIWFAIALGAGLYLLKWIRLPHDDVAPVGPTRRLIGVGTLGVAGWLLAAQSGASLGDLSAFLPPRDYGAGAPRLAEEQWLKNDLETAKARAKAEGKPLLINFTGYACTNCRLMENNVLPKPQVREAVDDFVAVELFTDGTDAKSRAFSKYQQEKFGTVAIPLYAVVTPEGEIQSRLEGLERDPDKFALWLTNSKRLLQARAQ